jgi:putative copper resistance protein D
MAGFLDVVLRGVILAGQALAVGGVVFLLWVLRPAQAQDAAIDVRAARVARWMTLGAIVVAVGQALALVVQLTALADGGSWPLREVAATLFFRVTLARAAAAILFAAAGVALARAPRDRRWSAATVALSALVIVLASWTSHAAARPGERALLLAADALHQAAAFVWIGGLAHLIVAVLRDRAAPWPRPLLSRFSALALTSVTVIVVAGVGLSAGYIDGLLAVVGTAYGVMVLTKVALLGLLLGLGALNYRAVRRGDTVLVPRQRLHRYVEVELGIGLTVLFAAASLTSLPPAVDVVADRATPAEVATRFTPRWPTFTSPAHSELPVDDRYAPRTDADRAWSEYNHNVAGVFVFVMGLLAILHVMRGTRWAAYWPLLFVALAAFLLVRDDPGSWPLGPQGFWEGFAYPEVLQHRVFVLIIIAFAVFETMVRTGRLQAGGAGLAFPLLCAAGGALLLTHSHASLNLKAEFLTEVTHAPLGVFGILVGWGRWLELRLPGGGRLPARVWAASLAIVGVLLIFYRES